MITFSTAPWSVRPITFTTLRGLRQYLSPQSLTQIMRKPCFMIGMPKMTCGMRTSGCRSTKLCGLQMAIRLPWHGVLTDNEAMKRYIREILPNGLPIIIDAELDSQGRAIPDTVRVAPVAPCMECEDCSQGDDDLGSCAVVLAYQTCFDLGQRTKLAERLSKIQVSRCE